MNGLLLLLFCIGILGAQLCEAEGTQENNTSLQLDQGSKDPNNFTGAAEGRSEASSSMTTVSLFSSSHSTSAPGTSAPGTSAPGTSAPGPQYPKTTVTITAPNGLFDRKECLTVLMVTGGLIIGCSILLISILLLAWKLWQSNRRIKMLLSSNGDMISNSEYWMGNAKKNNSRSETEAKETIMLTAAHSTAMLTESQEDMGDGITKEEGGEANEDGQMGEENKKEVGDTANSEEASAGEIKKETPVTTAENPSSSKQQEDTNDSQSTQAVAASSSYVTEEPKV